MERMTLCSSDWDDVSDSQLWHSRASFSAMLGLRLLKERSQVKPKPSGIPVVQSVPDVVDVRPVVICMLSFQTTDVTWR